MEKKLKEIKKRLKYTWDELYDALKDEGVSVSRSTFDNWAYGRSAPRSKVILSAFEGAYKRLRGKANGTDKGCKSENNKNNKRQSR